MSDMQNQQDPKALIKKVLAPIAEDMAAVDAVIRSELASDVPRMKEISEYITSAGGKRMRPALLMLICRALGYEGTLHQYLGATIELLHTATLMHDDVVDESDMRRGRPTANSRWGNGAAVLVGDFLYTRSFQMMVKAGNLRVMEALSDAANRLSEGEVVQMVNAHDPSVDETRYFRVIERKTACLFEAGARMAAAIADCGPEKEEADAVSTGLQIADGSSLQLLFNPASDQLSLKAASEYIERRRMLATRLSVNASNRGDSLAVYASAEDLYAGVLHLPRLSLTGGARQNRVHLSAGLEDPPRRRRGQGGGVEPGPAADDAFPR